MAVVHSAGSSLPFYRVRWDDGLQSLTPFGPDFEVDVEADTPGISHSALGRADGVT